MRILFLTQIIPYPPDAGPKVKTWHVLRSLAERGHQIVLVSFIRPEEEGYVSYLREVCADIYTIPIHRSRIADIGYWLRSQFSGRPFLIERDDIKAMRSRVQELLDTFRFDYIHADQLTMTQFALPAALERPQGVRVPNRKTGWTQPKLVFDAHNAVWTIIQRMAQNVPWYLRPVLNLEARRVKQYEGRIVDTFDHTLAVTEVDSRYLLDAQSAYQRGHQSTNGARRRLGKSGAITVVPIAIDTELLQPVQRHPGSKNIFTLGTLHYPPNADGIRWFVKEVFPLVRQSVPEATLTITGRNPPADFYHFPEVCAGVIKVTGYVPDLRPLMEASALVVIPVRAGSGMRVRILEAFAWAMPVVTTSVGLEGIDAHPGEGVLVADTPWDFAFAVMDLLENEALQAQLASRGRSLAERLFDWRVVLKRMEKIYGPLDGDIRK